mgnify:CR=1 FL=1
MSVRGLKPNKLVAPVANGANPTWANVPTVAYAP